MKVSKEIAQQIAETILNQIRACAGWQVLACWGAEKKIPMVECAIETDKGTITADAFGGGLQMDCINHTIADVMYRLVRVYVIYNRVPDDYTVVVTAPKMKYPVDSEEYYNVQYMGSLALKEPETLLYKNTGFYFDDLGRIIDGVIETGTFAPNYGE